LGDLLRDPARSGGVLRTAEAVKAGIHRCTLYAMRHTGIIAQLNRGLFRLADAPHLGQPDLVTVALKVPNGVICLIAALANHDLTTQIPHEVHPAIPWNRELRELGFPPIRLFPFEHRDSAKESRSTPSTR
jgi:predicted transcriptional regulator of viral defense system